ncbi:MAG: copper amine oxidase N-terminal domain-containing protein [Tissierellales bacterium]
MKKVIKILLIGMILLFSATSLAGGYFKRIEVLINGTRIEVNGGIIETDTEPFIYNSRTFVPIRAIAESLGCEVKWDNGENKVIISKYKDFPECDYLNGEIFVYGMIRKIDHENRTIEIEQHIDDNTIDVTPILTIIDDVIIILQRSDKVMNIEFQDLKCGDVLGAIIDKDGLVRGITMSL